jgi:predicted metal-dependent peptidase
MLVFFTDGYGLFPPQEPDYPVLWVLTPNSIEIERVPFGRVTKLQ